MNPCLSVLASASLLALVSIGPARAQGFDFSGGGSREPIAVEADNGIEWQQNTNQFIARGNAVATRGRMKVHADILTAYYREKDGKSEIYRLDADGNTIITSPTEKVVGKSATYDIDKAVLVVRGGGKPVVMTTQTDQVIANETLEYWEQRRQAVARGGAKAIREQKQIQADTLTGEFKQNDKGALVLSTSQAFGNVLLTTPSEVITGDRGLYNLETGIATLTGSVKITRSDNQLNGGYAQVNLNTGISQLFASAPGQGKQAGGRQRVQGLFTPERKSAPEAPPSAESGR